MKDIWLMADTHFGHKGVTQFLGRDGEKLRPWDNENDMDEALVENCNKLVKPNDRLYILGDLSISRRAISTVARCNGKKVLVRGNHDIYRINDYLPYFDDIRGSHKLENFILTHIPIHPDSLARWTDGNIHGHLHDGEVCLPDGTVDNRYLCVSMERINFHPIHFEEVKEIFNKRKNLLT